MMAETKKPPKPLTHQLRELSQGLVESEGWRRLSIVAGLIPAVPVLAVCLFLILRDSSSWWRPGVWWLTPSGTPMVVNELMGAAIAATVAFLIPWGIIQLIGWVVEGFNRADR
jgi:hypothetical protein